MGAHCQAGQQRAEGREVCAPPPRCPNHHEGAGISAWGWGGKTWPAGSVHWGVCVEGGSSFEVAQSLVLRHCIPAGWLPVQMHSCPESPRRLLLGIWPHILQIQGEIWQSFPLFPPHLLTLERGSHQTGQTSYPPSLGGLAWCLAGPGGFGTHVPFELHKAVPARPSVLCFPLCV